MRNLTDNPNADAWAQEARVAGITSDGTGGAVDFGNGFTLRVDRRWLYASARLAPPLPVEAGVTINALPHTTPGTKYSGSSGTLGDVARVDGNAGGYSAEDIRRRCASGVSFWHVDTVEGLSALVTTLRTVVAGLDADTCAAEHRRVETEEWLTDCVEYLAQCTAVGRMIREDLHTNANLDGAHPKIVQLRARYPREGL